MRSAKLIYISLFLFSLSFNKIESSAKEPFKDPKFKVVAFYTGKNDRAHVSFVHEANRWFSRIAPEYGFTYDSTSNWNNMNDSFLGGYDVVVFLDTRPDSSFQRAAFRKYKMLYINMGHNVIDYENKTNRELSFTFENEIQNKLITDGLIWLGK